MIHFTKSLFFVWLSTILIARNLLAAPLDGTYQFDFELDGKNYSSHLEMELLDGSKPKATQYGVAAKINEEWVLGFALYLRYPHAHFISMNLKLNGKERKIRFKPVVKIEEFSGESEYFTSSYLKKISSETQLSAEFASATLQAKVEVSGENYVRHTPIENARIIHHPQTGRFFINYRVRYETTAESGKLTPREFLDSENWDASKAYLGFFLQKEGSVPTKIADLRYHSHWAHDIEIRSRNPFDAIFWSEDKQVKLHVVEKR